MINYRRAKRISILVVVALIILIASSTVVYYSGQNLNNRWKSTDSILDKTSDLIDWSHPEAKLKFTHNSQYLIEYDEIVEGSYYPITEVYEIFEKDNSMKSPQKQLLFSINLSWRGDYLDKSSVHVDDKSEESPENFENGFLQGDPVTLDNTKAIVEMIINRAGENPKRIMLLENTDNTVSTEELNNRFYFAINNEVGSDEYSDKEIYEMVILYQYNKLNNIKQFIGTTSIKL